MGVFFLPIHEFSRLTIKPGAYSDDIDEQREAPEDLSSELQNLLEYFCTPGDTLFVYSCKD